MGKRGNKYVGCLRCKKSITATQDMIKISYGSKIPESEYMAGQRKLKRIASYHYDCYYAEKGLTSEQIKMMFEQWVEQRRRDIEKKLSKTLIDELYGTYYMHSK